MPRIELDAAIEELYSAPREEFIPLRRQLAKDARAAGDTATAAEIDKLAKPTTAAWVANQLARGGAAEAHELAELGDALRTAHEQLNGAELKSLSHKRTELIRELVRLAGERHAPSESVIRELEEILTRVVADSDAAAAFTSGRLTSAKGFAPAPAWPNVPAEPRPEKPAGRKPKSTDDQRERARQALEEARAAVKETEAARADDERALADAEAATEEAAAEVRRLGEELDAAEAREKCARGLVAMARRAVKEAERATAAAWRQVQQAELRLTELDEK